MEANELMIGDWVRISEPCKYHGAIGRIKTLIDHKDDENAYFKVFLQNNTIHIGIEDICSDDIRPIPLTPENLEKIGFETDDDAHFFIQGQDNTLELLLVELPFDAYTFDIVRTERTINRCNQRCYIDRYFASIYYVHQLQHALRLCGIEKEFEL